MGVPNDINKYINVMKIYIKSYFLNILFFFLYSYLLFFFFRSILYFVPINILYTFKNMIDSRINSNYSVPRLSWQVVRCRWLHARTGFTFARDMAGITFTRARALDLVARAFTRSLYSQTWTPCYIYILTNKFIYLYRDTYTYILVLYT